ncbi:MAG: hypothetical protein EYC70_12685 [Planctomycetota bacterium]|nr:MAG: hypothetical protein EYC70_12685 [Planctomycetota bacterium]
MRSVYPSALAVLVLALLCDLSQAQDAVPARIPVTLTPEEFRFFACAGRPGEEGEHVRAFFLLQKAGTPGRVEFPGVDLTTDQPDDWTSSKGQVADGELQVTVTFRPQAVRTSTATLKIQVDYPLGGGRVTETITLALEGRGVVCGPATPPAGGGDPPPAGGTPPDGAPGGGATPASGPADIELCLKFHLVDGPPPRPTDADFDAWVDEVNRTFAGSGVRFKRSPPTRNVPSAPETGEPELAEEDPHCLDVYIVDDIPGPTLGDGDVLNPESEEWRAMLRELGIDPDSPLGKNMGYGRRCRVEIGRNSGRTLAHELGHILGLGAGPDPIHRDPETGDDIEDGERLMHGTPQGTKLTDKEKQIARRLARWIEDHRSPCGGSQQRVPSPRNEQLDPRGDLRFASLLALDRELVFTAFLEAPFDLAATSPALSLELDTDLDGAADHFVSSQFADNQWLTEQEPPAELRAPVPAPEALFEIHLPAPVPDRRAGALQLRVPREFLPQSYGPLGWRLALSQRALGTDDAVPAQGFSTLDITTPALAITLDGNLRQLRVAPNSPLTLSGSLITTPTLDGQIDFSARILSDQGLLQLPLGTLDKPAPDIWSFAATLPADLAPASTFLSVIARCSRCQRVTSDVAALELVDDSGGGLPLLLLLLSLVALAGLVLLLSRRKRTPAAT